jgi:molybdate transport system ATP-binding protein
VIDLALQLAVSDRHRRFALDVAFRCEAPVLALFGPSGAGKSLTLQAMAGLLRPDAGHVRLAGRTLFDSRAGVHLAPEQRGLGYLFQHYALFPHLTVRENVAFGLTTWRRRRLPADGAARVDALLQSFGLHGAAHSRPATLSGGQQQRVALARALACEPRALLLDEPFAALNPLLRRQLRNELAAARQRAGVPMVIVTHDVDDVLALADQVVLIDEGRVAGQLDMHSAPPEQLRHELLHRFGAA